MNKIKILAGAALGLICSIQAFPSDGTPDLRAFSTGGGYLTRASDNCMWATYREPQSDGEAGADPVAHIIRLSDGEIVDIYDNTLSPVDGVVCYDISDDGKVIVGSLNDKPAVYRNGAWTELKTGDPMIDRLYVGSLRSVTPDGKRVCGWMYEGLTNLHGFVWDEENKLVEITGLPTYKDIFEQGRLSEEYMPEDGKEYPSFIFDSLSADGNKMLVGVDHNHWGWGASWLVYDIPTQTYTWIGGPEYTGSCFVRSAYLSNNGEWVAGDLFSASGASTGFRLKVSTGEMEIFDRPSDSDILPSAIGNDGLLFSSGPASSPSHNVYIYNDGLWIDLGTLAYQCWNMDLLQETGYDSTGYVVSVSDDCRSIVCQAEVRSSAFALTVPESFKAACESVNVLSSWMVDPYPGSSFSALTTVNFSISYPCEWTGKNAVVKCEGSEIGKSIEIKAFGTTGRVYQILFDNLRMLPGKTYDIVLPEGTFKVADSSMVSPEIEFSYQGRAEAPVEVLKVTPAEGSSVNEISATSSVKFTFDGSVDISTRAKAYLYDKDSESPLAELSIVVDGASVSVYPPAARKLNKGKEYSVVIEEGSIVDLMGNNGNNRISVDYKGAFIPSFESGRYLFEDSFDEPSSSMGRFLLYEGDHLRPTSDMAALTFDKDNTPWNFTIRDDNNYDYCAASHSSYQQEGASDDWMSLPRVRIPNKFCSLSFKAQALAGSKGGNNLKIVVWESDETFGSLDTGTVEQMRKEAKVIFEESLPVAKSNTLEGNWHPYELSLSEFNGKNVYIAFVNENDKAGMICVDDIKIISDGNFEITSLTEKTVIDQPEAKVKGNLRLRNVTGSMVKLLCVADGFEDEKTMDISDLAKESDLEFEFDKPLPLTVGKSTPFTIIATIGDETQTVSSSVSDLAFEPHKRVIIEEGTGAWCGNCPRGILALEYLEKAFPDRVVAIAIHNGDEYAYDSYTAANELGGYPSARINRGDVASPMNSSYQFMSDDGTISTWADVVAAELAFPTYGEVEVTDFVHHTGDNTIEVKLKSRFALDMEDTAYNIFACILEDDLFGMQHNYLSNSEVPTYGSWATMGAVVPVEYKDVARKILNEEYMGRNGKIPAEVVAGRWYEANVGAKYDFPYLEEKNLKVAVAIINAADGSVVNAAVYSALRTDDGEFIDQNSVRHVESDDHIVRVIDGTVYVNGNSEEVTVYSLSGEILPNRALLKGIYIIRTAEGFTAKTIVK